MALCHRALACPPVLQSRPPNMLACVWARSSHGRASSRSQAYISSLSDVRLDPVCNSMGLPRRPYKHGSTWIPRLAPRSGSTRIVQGGRSFARKTRRLWSAFLRNCKRSPTHRTAAAGLQPTSMEARTKSISRRCANLICAQALGADFGVGCLDLRTRQETLLTPCLYGFRRCGRGRGPLQRREVGT